MAIGTHQGLVEGDGRLDVNACRWAVLSLNGCAGDELQAKHDEKD